VGERELIYCKKSFDNSVKYIKGEFYYRENLHNNMYWEICDMKYNYISHVLIEIFDEHFESISDRRKRIVDSLI
jgi:hypothetical protein